MLGHYLKKINLKRRQKGVFFPFVCDINILYLRSYRHQECDAGFWQDKRTASGSGKLDV